MQDLRGAFEEDEPSFSQHHLRHQPTFRLHRRSGRSVLHGLSAGHTTLCSFQ